MIASGICCGRINSTYFIYWLSQSNSIAALECLYMEDIEKTFSSNTHMDVQIHLNTEILKNGLF